MYCVMLGNANNETVIQSCSVGVKSCQHRLLGHHISYYCSVILVFFTLGLKHVSFTNPVFANTWVSLKFFLLRPADVSWWDFIFYL